MNILTEFPSEINHTTIQNPLQGLISPQDKEEWWAFLFLYLGPTTGEFPVLGAI